MKIFWLAFSVINQLIILAIALMAFFCSALFKGWSEPERCIFGFVCMTWMYVMDIRNGQKFDELNKK